MTKVLIITYHWPPAGGPGVQRVLKFARYLPQFGWDPLVLTVAGGEYPARDETLIREIPEDMRVFKTRSLEPFSLYKRVTGLSEHESIPTAVLAERQEGWKRRTAHWVRLNLFIPDAKIGWLPFAESAGKSIIDQYQPAIIFSSSPPPVVHLIAKKLKKKHRLKWVADFRDPWTDIHYYEDQKRLKAAKLIDHKLELSVLKTADAVSCISRLDIELDFSRKIDETKCFNIPNGYDEADFTGLEQVRPPEGTFNLIHLGAVGRERVPHLLIKSIHRLADEKLINPADFTLTFIGKVAPALSETCKTYQVESFIKYIPYLPHREALKQAGNGHALLLLITQSGMNRRILPGKTFEYMRLKKPILALGPEDGEVARILKETQSGNVIDYHNEDAIFQRLRAFIQREKSKSPERVMDLTHIKPYSRKHLTGQLAELFDRLCYTESQ
jgi:glycosyltransferase involved in cell wall biosynthesis